MGGKENVQGGSGFNVAITRLLQEKLKVFIDRSVTAATSLEIYTTIFETIAEVMTAAKAPLSNESVNYIAQMYYDGVQVTNAGGTIELDPNVFSKRASLDNISTKELVLLATMFRGCEFVVPFVEEIRRRS